MADETYTLIRRNTLSASASSITLSSIPQTFTDLVVKISSRCDAATTQYNSFIRPNAATTGYREVAWYFYNGTVYPITGASTSIYYSYATGATALANTYSSNEIYISNYSSTTLFKQFSVDSTVENNNTGTGYVIINDGGTWASASQMTSLYLAPEAGNYIAGTTVSLYGIAKYGVSPVAGPKASGGDIITNDGTYWIHQFLNSGTFTPSQSLTCDYLVVAGGGGGGGASHGSGGGAGGYRTSIGGTALSVTAQAYAITVGAGGTGGIYNGSNKGVNGNDSLFSSITSTGGGGGGSNPSSEIGSTGGSGGGSAYLGSGTTAGGVGNTPSTSPSQGNNGGGGTFTAPNYGAGGGGGASAVGATGTGSTGGNGGAGSANSISGSSVTYAGGGGGSSYNGGTPGTGGSGGGGNGSTTTAPTSGSVNTGGGGGGAERTGTTTGGTGGSGIVIIRYAMA